MDSTTTAASLAARSDFALGSVTIQPSLRTVTGPAGSAKLEPRVMRVLAALADACGQVLSREYLLEHCWDGRVVGDDAINRTIAEIRRVAQSIGADFVVQTVPRVGYRITQIQTDLGEVEPERKSVAFDRRRMLAAGALGAIAIASGSVAIVHVQRNHRLDTLIARGIELQASGTRQGKGRAEAVFREVIAQDPARADAWGWLATVLDNYDNAREAARRALELDRKEANARAVLAVQQLDIEAWTKWEDALLAVLHDDPHNALSLGSLGFFYQGMGRCRDSWQFNERLTRIRGYELAGLHIRALKNWIFGRVETADRIADRGMELRPQDGPMWNARMLIYACTDRAEAGLALLDNVASRPANLSQPSMESWRAALTAIATRAPSEVQRCVEVFYRVAPMAPGLAANAIMICSYLGRIDEAYRFANGLFGDRGALVQRVRGGSIDDIYAGTAWGRTQFLFIPATRAFRADPRFVDLCQSMGHVTYWRQRGIWPDPFVRGAIEPAKLM